MPRKERKINTGSTGYTVLDEAPIEKNTEWTVSNGPFKFPPSTTIDVSHKIGELISAPISELASGRAFTDRSSTIASVSPILGQYAGKLSYAYDWGMYWEYLQSYILVPEVKYAVNMKTDMMWNNGWEINADNDKLEQKITKRLRKLHFEPSFKSLAKTAYITGNGYAEMVTGGEYKYDEQKETFIEMHEPEGLYGFKHLDPRTMRRFVNAWNYDPEINDVQVVRFIQRVYTTPLGPRPMRQYLVSGNEINIRPQDMVHLRFNRIMDSIYGYSLMHETMMALKGYLIMQQFIPMIFQKRADPRVQIKLGGNIYRGGQLVTMMPVNASQIDRQRNFIETMSPGQDMYTDMLTTIEEIYKTPNSVRGLEAYLDRWEERLFHGLNIPRPNRRTFRESQLEVENLMNEVQNQQQEIEDIVNRQVIPSITSKECEFQFKDLVPDDWMGKARVATQLMQSGIINKDWALQMLDLPKEAGIGAMPFTQWGMNPSFGTPAGGVSNVNKDVRMKSPKAQKTPNYTGLSKPKKEDINALIQESLPFKMDLDARIEEKRRK